MTNKLVTVKKYRFLFLKNTTTEINTDTVVKAYTEKNKDESFGRKREFYHGFDLIFILNNGQRLVLLEGEIDLTGVFSFCVVFPTKGNSNPTGIDLESQVMTAQLFSSRASSTPEVMVICL